MSFVPGTLTLKDGPQLNPFHRLRVAGVSPLFDSKQEYGLDTLRMWDITANGTLSNRRSANDFVADGAGNLVGPRNLNTGFTPITVTATNGHYSILQSGQYVQYIPGVGQLIYITGIFAAGVGAEASLVLRSSTSGSAVDEVVPQADWSVDTFGAGSKNPSGITVDFTKVQILAIDAQMLFAGRVRTYLDIKGKLYEAHQFEVANEQDVPTMQTFNLPVRLEGRTDASTTKFRVGYFDLANGVFLQTSRTTKGGTIQFECCSVQSEGPGEQRGFPLHVGTSPTARVSVTLRQPILSIRPKATYNGKTNRAHIELAEFLISAQTNNCYYEIVIGGTLTGASWSSVGVRTTAGAFVVGGRYTITTIGTTDFTLIGAASNTVGVEFVATGVGAGSGTATIVHSMSEFDTSATAISGGICIKGGRAMSGAGVVALVTQESIDPRGPLVLRQIDALTAFQTPLSIVVTSESGTSNVTGDIQWYEQVI